jgi:NADPH:quinone reductase-like Zn-dependent oxidoreductase
MTTPSGSYRAYHIVRKDNSSDPAALLSLTVRHHPSIPQPLRGQVIVSIRAAAVNYRDLRILSGDFPSDANIIPLGDGAGQVVSVGEGVSQWKPGDRVYATFIQDWRAGQLTDAMTVSALGAACDGVLTEYAAFDAATLLPIPSHLSYEEAATLPVAATTAWHALFEFTTRPVGPGQTVLVLGTGGVSVFAAQFAMMSGARVIITSSSDAKIDRMKALGVSAGINYNKHTDWSRIVLELTDGVGVDHVIDTVGSSSLGQSLSSVRRGGHVHALGVLGGRANAGFDVAMTIMMKGVTVRSASCGSTEMGARMNRAIEMSRMKPVIDRVFEFDNAPAAYTYITSGTHLGKVVIRIGGS